MRLIKIALIICSLIHMSCGGTLGTCYITCTQPTSSGYASHDVGPYYDETDGSCASETQSAQEELEAWDAVCTYNLVPY